jgi:hypothetical protein
VERQLDSAARLRHRGAEVVGHGDWPHGGAEVETPCACHPGSVYGHCPVHKRVARAQRPRIERTTIGRGRVQPGEERTWRNFYGP